MHIHDYSHLIIPLTDGTLIRTATEGRETLYKLKVGKAMSFAEDPLEGFHTDFALGKAPLKVVVAQLRKNSPVLATTFTDEDLNQALVK